jgi:hypothetical protein
VIEEDRLDGESKAAYTARIYADNMRAARADRKETHASSEAALKVKNATIARQQGEMAKKRMAFLMKQQGTFQQFLGAEAMGKVRANADAGDKSAPPSPGGPKRVRDKLSRRPYSTQHGRRLLCLRGCSLARAVHLAVRLYSVGSACTRSISQRVAVVAVVCGSV